MPINSAPQRGFADWGRTEDWDSGIIFAVNRPTANQNVDQTTIKDVSRYAYIGGNNIIGGPAIVAIRWYPDAAGSINIGQREFVLHDQITNYAQYRLPNLGPFASVNWTGVGFVNFANIAQMFGTNRYHPLEFIPTRQVLHALSAIAVGAATNVNAYPVDYYAGPVSAVVSSVGGASTFVAQAMTSAGVVINISPGITPAANVVTILDFVSPPGAWWIAVLNPGAATTYSITSVASMTGSS